MSGNNNRKIEKGKRAAATQGFLYVLSCFKNATLNNDPTGSLNIQKNRLSDKLRLIRLLLGFPIIYSSLDVRMSWACAKNWSKRLLKDDVGLCGRILFWIVMNHILWMFKWYLYENNLTTEEASHAYGLLKDKILTAITNERIPSGLYEIKQICDSGLKKYDWQDFVSASGCLFSSGECQLLSALLCANANDVAVFTTLLIDLSSVLAEDQKLTRQKAYHRCQKFLKAIRDMLEVYCDKMCVFAQKSKDVTVVQKWYLAKQTISKIRAKSPSLENEQEIKELVEEFCSRVNEAGALTCAYRVLSLSEMSQMPYDSLDECRRRVAYFKKCIEEHDVYSVITDDTNERALQLMFRLVWYGSEFDSNRECANGMGQCDFAASNGAHDKCIIEIKLGSNSSLLAGLKHQLNVYKKVNNTDKGIYLVVCRTEKEINRCRKYANECGLKEDEDIFIADATHKRTASKVK